MNSIFHRDIFSIILPYLSPDKCDYSQLDNLSLVCKSWKDELQSLLLRIKKNKLIRRHAFLDTLPQIKNLKIYTLKKKHLFFPRVHRDIISIGYLKIFKSKVIRFNFSREIFWPITLVCKISVLAPQTHQKVNKTCSTQHFWHPGYRGSTCEP